MKKQTPSEFSASLLGVPKAFSYQARLVRCVRDMNGMNQVTIGAIGVSPDPQDENEKGDWERWDCDIIIVPRKKFSISEKAVKGMRVDQVMQTLSDDTQWKEVKETKSKK